MEKFSLKQLSLHTLGCIGLLLFTACGTESAPQTPSPYSSKPAQVSEEKKEKEEQARIAAAAANREREEKQARANRTEMQAALRRDIQLANQSLSRVRGDIQRKEVQINAIRNRIQQAEFEAAATVPEQTPPPAGTDATSLAIARQARQRAIQAAEVKKAQLYALADDLKIELAGLLAELEVLEQASMEIEENIYQLNEELNEISIRS